MTSKKKKRGKSLGLDSFAVVEIAIHNSYHHPHPKKKIKGKETNAREVFFRVTLTS